MPNNASVSDQLHAWFPDVTLETSSYLINLSKRWRYLYLEIPKVACSTIKRSLHRLELGDGAELPKDIHLKSESPLLGPFEDPTATIKAQTDEGWTRFAFTRNPYARIVSCFLNKFGSQSTENDPQANRRMLMGLGLGIRRQPDFLEFLSAVKEQPHCQMDIHWLPQTIVFKGFVAPAIIGRFERFESHFTEILRHIGGTQYPSIEDARKYYPHFYNIGAESILSRLVGKKERELISEIYRDDFDALGYSPDPRETHVTKPSIRQLNRHLAFISD
jgi:hypothetical protein